MGRACGCRRRGAERLACPAPALRLRPLLQLLLGLCCGASLGHCQQGSPAASPPPQCRIQKCTSDFVTLTSHLTPAADGFDLDFCSGLRAYSSCTTRTAKACRGNLVFHSAVLGISDLMSQRNCSRDGPTSATQPEEPLPEPCDYHGRMLHAHAVHTHAHMHAHHAHGGHAHAHGGQAPPALGGDMPPGYLFCGLFGDPHLRTFRDSFQTCKVEGAWPLIDNRFLSVQVTNVPVVSGSSATATNKITVIFKPFEACTEQRVYQAQTDNLPAAFDDGTVSSDPSFFSSSSLETESSSSSPGGGGGASASTGPDGRPRALWIRERAPGRHVELHARYIGVTLVVRQLGRYLTLALRIPEELALTYDPETQDLQLCLNGCPSAERIDRGQGRLPLPAPAASPPALGLQAQRGGGVSPPRGGGFSVEAAQQRCSERLQHRDIYFQSCVFDLLTTGDANFTAAALSALTDMESLHPHKERWRIYPAPRSSAPPAVVAAPRPMAAAERLCAAVTLVLLVGSGVVF